MKSNMTNTVRKRVVSKTALFGMRLHLNATEGIFAFLMAVSGIMAVFCFLLAVTAAIEGTVRGKFLQEVDTFLIGLITSGLLALFTYACSQGARASNVKWQELSASTVTEISALPVSDILVRASKEPLQEHQTVLLRAAQSRQRTPEQLLRPVE